MWRTLSSPLLCLELLLRSPCDVCDVLRCMHAGDAWDARVTLLPTRSAVQLGAALQICHPAEHCLAAQTRKLGQAVHATGGQAQLLVHVQAAARS